MAEMFSMLVCDIHEYALGFSPVAFKGHKDSDFVPDVLEAFTVVSQHVTYDHSVGNIDNAPSALIGIDPIADLHETELKNANVDYVAAKLSDLNAVADGERTPPDNENPSHQPGDEILKRYGETCSDQTEKGGKAPEAFQPDDR
jgi:hypothetical protein